MLWGPVAQADVKIASEAASSVLIQTVSNANTGVPAACSNGGSENENTPTLLGANGILGVGLEPTDCFVQGLVNLCDGSVQAPIPAYFDCPSSGCASTDTQITIRATSKSLIRLWGSRITMALLLVSRLRADLDAARTDGDPSLWD